MPYGRHQKELLDGESGRNGVTGSALTESIGHETVNDTCTVVKPKFHQFPDLYVECPSSVTPPQSPTLRGWSIINTNLFVDGLHPVKVPSRCLLRRQGRTSNFVRNRAEGRRPYPALADLYKSTRRRPSVSRPVGARVLRLSMESDMPLANGSLSRARGGCGRLKPRKPYGLFYN